MVLGDLRNEETNTGANRQDERLWHDTCQPLPETQEREDKEDPAERHTLERDVAKEI